MSNLVSSWIAKAVVKYDREHGSNLKTGVSGIKRLVQIQKFLTYRKPDDPQAQIIALISDKTHHLIAEFDVEATNRFESEDTDLPTERLTSKLRHIIMIKAYRWKVESPRERTPDGLEMPVLKMEILDFDDYFGSRDEPNYFEDVVDVLRKWYFGESHSDMSEVEKSFEKSQPSQPQAGPSRLSMSSPVQSQKKSTLPENVITLADFLEPYLADEGEKRGKVIPDWLFETSEEDRATLEAITMFGLELDRVDSSHVVAASDRKEATPSPRVFRVLPAHGSSPQQSTNDKGKGRAVPSPPAVSEAEVTVPKSSVDTAYHQTPPVPLGQRFQYTQIATQAVTFPESSGGPADNEDSESESDVEMQIKPLRHVRQPRRSRIVLDPLAFPGPVSPPAANEQTPDSMTRTQRRRRGRSEQREEPDGESGQETDFDMLSDYERQARQRKRSRKASTNTQAVSTMEDVSAEMAPPPNEQVEEDESIPASESLESYSLTNQYPSPSKKGVVNKETTAERTRDTLETGTVVDHGTHTTVQSLPKSLNSSENYSNPNARTDGTDSLPTPPPSDHEAEAQLPSIESVSLPRSITSDSAYLLKTASSTPRAGASQRTRRGPGAAETPGAERQSVGAVKSEPTSLRKTELPDLESSKQGPASCRAIDPSGVDSHETAKQEPMSSQRSNISTHDRSNEASSSRHTLNDTPSGSSRTDHLHLQDVAKQEPSSLRRSVKPDDRANEASSSRHPLANTPTGPGRHGHAAKHEPLSRQKPSLSFQDGPPEASSSRVTLDARPAGRKARYTLDLTVPGLSNAKIQEYIDKVRIARSTASNVKREK